MSATDGRIRQQTMVGGGGGPMSEHTGTSSPSPAGSTYTTASESGGPNTIESEPGTYLSASEDLVNMVNLPTSRPMPVSNTVVEAIYPPMVNNYNQGYCNSAEVTMIPQQGAPATHDLRVSIFFLLFFKYLPSFLYAFLLMSM